MALAQVGLGSITQVGAASTQVVYTVGSAKTAYIRGIQLHSLDSTFITNVAVHIVPTTGGGSIGAASSITRIIKVGLSTEDTFFYENAYPITMNNDGDTIQVNNQGTGSVNVLILGDREG
tara:strand:+ start:4844 stop:5203 length:360 start_codon:yes stop_codon:yes gene_type:complete